jgi:hypothetical protein
MTKVRPYPPIPHKKDAEELTPDEALDELFSVLDEVMKLDDYGDRYHYMRFVATGIRIGIAAKSRSEIMDYLARRLPNA